MNIYLWIAQGLLIGMFFMAGLAKAMQPKEKLKSNMPWVEDVSDRNVKLIGISQVLAAIGLILPQLTGILPWLTPLAAACLVLTMIGAMSLHYRRAEWLPMAINFVLLLLAAFVAYGRFVLVPA